MSPIPRLLTIMGSGETSPTMVKTHRGLLARLGPPPVPAVVLDTPFGFQANADELTARAVDYFRQSVGHSLTAASFRSADGVDPVAYETMLSRLREARYVFAGPGSPSYALRQWAASRVPDLLAEKLERGGAITFASAAALTVGAFTVPVYEIYKVGEDPHWLDGLDLLAHARLRAAVIPHFNNAEGGTHDTRFCYLGEARLDRMERELPPDVFVLGVDEHTGLVLDLDAGTATVVGLGVVTVRDRGHAREIPAGETVPIGDLARMAVAAPAAPAARSASPAPGPTASAPASPLLDVVAEQSDAFDDAVAKGDVAAAVRAVLALEDALAEWANETFSGDERDRARAALRSMVVRLGELAETGARDPAEVVGPFVDLLVEVRDRARAERRWSEADAIRDRLVALGVEVGDARAGTSWRLLS